MDKSLIGIIVLIADIYAIIKIAQSSASALAKALWIVGVLIFPVVGFIVWLLIGPGGSKK